MAYCYKIKNKILRRAYNNLTLLEHSVGHVSAKAFSSSFVILIGLVLFTVVVVVVHLPLLSDYHPKKLDNNSKRNFLFSSNKKFFSNNNNSLLKSGCRTRKGASIFLLEKKMLQQYNEYHYHQHLFPRA